MRRANTAVATDQPCDRDTAAGARNRDGAATASSPSGVADITTVGVDAVGVSSLAAGHLTLLPALKQALADQGRPDIMIVIGGVIPPDDVETLKEMGAAAVFLPGTVIAESALDLLARLRA